MNTTKPCRPISGPPSSTMRTTRLRPTAGLHGTGCLYGRGRRLDALRGHHQGRAGRAVSHAPDGRRRRRSPFPRDQRFLEPELDARVLHHHVEPGRSRLHPDQPRQRLCLLQLRAEVGYADQGHRPRRYLSRDPASPIMPWAVSTRPGSTGSRPNSRRARTRASS